MAVREWVVETPRPHDVRLEHGCWSGRARIFVDGKLVFERPITINEHGFEHQLIVDGVPCVVRVQTNGVTFSYSLAKNEVLHEPEPKPLRTPASSLLSRVMVLAFLTMFAVFWLCVGSAILPLRRIPPRQRMFYLVLGLIHVPVIVWYWWATRAKGHDRDSGTRPASPANDPGMAGPQIEEGPTPCS